MSLERIQKININTFEAAPGNAGKAEDLSGSTVPMTSGKAEEVNLDNPLETMGLEIENKNAVGDDSRPRTFIHKPINPPPADRKAEIEGYFKEDPERVYKEETRASDSATLYYNNYGQLRSIRDKDGFYIGILRDNTIELRDFDEKGNIKREALYDRSGKLKEFTDYSYDNSGRITDEVTYDGKNNVQEYTEYYYNLSGSLVEERRYNAMNIISGSRKVTYDAKNRMVLDQYFDMFGKEVDRLEEKYSDKPLPTKAAKPKSVPLPKGATIQAIQWKDTKRDLGNNQYWKYDDNGYVKTIYQNGKLKFKIDTYWDDRKNRYERNYYYNEFNSNGLKTKEIYVDEKGVTTVTEAYEYNDKKQLTRIVYYNAAGEPYNYCDFEYDENNNISGYNYDPEDGRLRYKLDDETVGDCLYNCRH